MRLSELQPGQQGRIVSIDKTSGDLSLRLLEMGFIEGGRVEVIHAAPFGDPFAVRVRGALMALRRAEAQLIEVST